MGNLSKKGNVETNNFTDKFETFFLDIKGVRLPEFEIEEKSNSIKDNYDFLESLCREGIKRKNIKDDKYIERLKYELSVIDELGFVDYILLVWDIINFCKKNNIPTGMGRGSAPASIILYLIDVTQIDPIKYNLYFERFISKIRAKKQVVDGITYLDGSLMCDIDLDICYYNRPKVLKALEEKFKGRTCKILTLNTLQGKLLIKECGKIIGDYSEDEVKTVANLIPELYGKVKDIEKACEEEKVFGDWARRNPKIYETALKLRGLIKNKSVHASAMMLTYDLMDDSTPTEISSNKEVISSYDMEFSSLTNVKLDLLGLRAVSIVDDVCKNIGIKMSDINLDDETIYQNLYELKTPHGLFQIEADSTFKACKKIKPKNLEELSAVLAISRPGALDFIDQYATFTNTGVKGSVHPFFDDILSNTGGICLYQEQLMRMINKVGFTLDEAETVRRLVGKKKVTEAKLWKTKIENKIKEQGLDSEISNVLWKILEDSSHYSFNRSHSISYASLCAITTYLKFNYPQQFFLSLLKMTKHEPEPIEEISKIHKELAFFNIKLLRPHILKSDLDFTIEEGNIRFGLLSIKGISDKSIEKLTKFRHEFSNKFQIFKAAEEAKLPLGVLCALIQAGTLDEIKQVRSRVVLEAQLWSILTDKKEKIHAIELGKEHNYDLVKIIKILNTSKTDEKGKLIIKDSRLDTIRKKYEPYEKIYKQNSKNESFACWYYENKLLGYSPEISLKEIFIKHNLRIMTSKEISGTDPDDYVTFVGFVKDFYNGVSKNKNKYYKITVGDEFGSMSVLLFEGKNKDKIENCKKENDGKLPKENHIVVVEGRKKDNAIFADKIQIQCAKIYTRLGELKESKSID